jgi:GNAT superfamily N-acetyltransferase
MKEEIIKINTEDHTLISDYKENEHYRASLNRLAKRTYGFDFEQWYREGYWGDRYRPYSLVHNGEVVANVSVNPIDFMAGGKLHHTLQIGTVMTDEAYRNMGLCRILMEYVIGEYEHTCDFIYLFANDTVLDFYPKFGFERAEEYNYTKIFTKQREAFTARELNIRDSYDKALINRLVKKTIPVSRYSMIGNPGLVMFYLISFMAQNIYYIKELDLAAIASYEEDNLFLTDVFCEHEFDLEKVINSLADKAEVKVTLGFTPPDTSSYQAELLLEAGTTFFVRGTCFIDKGRFPELSHA